MDELVTLSDRSWYCATIVVRIEVADDPRTVVHKNTLLVHALDDDDAYERAIELGKGHDLDYINPMGKAVSSRFLGLASLLVVHDELDHGAELFFEEEVGLEPDRVAAMVRPRDELEVFRAPPSNDDVPNYASVEVVEEARRFIRGEAKGPPN